MKHHSRTHFAASSTSPARLNRRRFLSAAAVLSSLTIVPRGVLGAAGQKPPSDKVNIAGIGVGGMGAANLNALASQNIVALCDVDHEYAANTFKTYPQAKRYTDYREMLDRQKDIDAVVIATPDHTHAVISMAAMRAGKHVYCQKPLTHTVHESRMLAEASRKYGVVTQMGIQGHSMDDQRTICEWIWDGAIGEVREVESWCSLTYYPWGHRSWSSQWGTRPKETPPIPAQLDWELWLGPAPYRPYHRAYHPATWRCWWDFGCGMMGDRGVHTLDVVNLSLKLGPPTSVEATSCGLDPEVHPLSAIVTFRFPARENLPPVKLTWYEGTRPPRPLEMDAEQPWPAEGGTLFKGSKGVLMCGVYGEAPKLLPLRLHEEYNRPAKTLSRIPDRCHELDWVRAIQSGGKAGADFAYSGPLTEVCLLGNIAKRIDGPIEWDSPNLKVTNSQAANLLVHTPYRSGWNL
jgi:predicted dehydrogenase